MTNLKPAFLVAKVAKHRQRFLVRALLRAKVIHSYQPLPWVGWNRSTRDVKATVKRWELIRENLPQLPFSALDIGCNTGYFSIKMAELGGFVVGIEQVKSLVWVANRIKECAGQEGVAFGYFHISLRNIDALGEYDVVLFLSVFHHLNYFYGFDPAKRMLKKLLSKTKRIMFFETGQSNKTGKGYASRMPDMGSEPEHWIEELLLECGARFVKHLGDASVGSGSTTRAVFAAEK